MTVIRSRLAAPCAAVEMLCGLRIKSALSLLPQVRRTQEEERQIQRDVPAQGRVRRGQRQDAVDG